MAHAIAPGRAFVKLSYLIPPFLLLLLGSAILSFVLWRRDSNYAKFLMISFALPFLAVPITAATYLVFGFSELDGDFGGRGIFDAGNVYHLWLCCGTAS